MSVPAAYAGVILIWSTTPLAVQWSTQGGGFLFGVASRMTLGLLLAALLVTGLKLRMPRHREALLTYLASGMGIFLAMTCMYWSARYLPSGWMSLLFGLAPIVTGVMAQLWLAESALLPVRALGMLTGVAGLAVVFGGSLRLGADAHFGVVGVLAAVCFFSASGVAVKRIGAHLPGLQATLGGLAVAVPMFLITFVISGEPVPAVLDARTVAAIVYLGLIGSVLGFSMYYYVLREVDATRVALITLIAPVLALILGHSINDEPLTNEVYYGAALILAGLMLYELGPSLPPWKAGRS